MYHSARKDIVKKSGLALALLGSVSIATQPIFVHADTSKEISQEKDKVDDHIQSVKKEMEKAESKVEQMKQDFEDTEKEIERVNKSMEETKKRIDKRTEMIGNRMAAIQQNQGNLHPYLEVLFGSDNFGDFISRMFAVSTIMNADQELLDAQTKDQSLQKHQKKELVVKRENLDEQFRTLQEEFAKLETKKAELEVLSLDLDDKLQDAKQKEARAKRLATLQSQSFEKQAINAKSFSSNVEMSDKAKAITQEAGKYLGWKYVWGGSTPNTSFDCSGLTQWAFKQAGINIPRTSSQQYLAAQPISANQVKPGDLVFFSYGKGIAHVGIYVGNGKMLNAQNSGVKVANLDGYWEQYIAGFGRVAGVN